MSWEGPGPSGEAVRYTHDQLLTVKSRAALLQGQTARHAELCDAYERGLDAAEGHAEVQMQLRTEGYLPALIDPQPIHLLVSDTDATVRSTAELTATLSGCASALLRVFDSCRSYPQLCPLLCPSLHNQPHRRAVLLCRTVSGAGPVLAGTRGHKICKWTVFVVSRVVVVFLCGKYQYKKRRIRKSCKTEYSHLPPKKNSRLYDVLYSRLLQNNRHYTTYHFLYSHFRTTKLLAVTTNRK